MRAMKKATKRMIALFLTAIMTLAMAATSFATMTEPMPAAATTGKLTVTVNANNSLKGQTISLYKLFDIAVSGESEKPNYEFTVNTKYAEILKSVLKLEGEVTSAQYYQAILALKNEDNGVQNFADALTKAALITDPVTEADYTSPKIVDEATNYVFESVDYGYYLVYQTGTKEFQSSLISVAKESENINLKGETPSIEKTADVTSVEIGQIVTYTIKGTIPDTTGYAEYVYKINDTLTDGLDFVEDENGTLLTGKDYKVSVQIADGEVEEIIAKLAEDNDRMMTLDLSEWIRGKQDKIGAEFTVTYYAKVNKNAVVDTHNKAELEYGNDPENTTTTTPSEAKTPTYPLDIEKTDTADNKLAGATFRLYREEADATNPENVDNAIKVEGAAGSYTVAANQAEGTMDMVTVATEVETGYNLRLNGLAAGIYWLVETEAPAGYNKLTAPIKVVITQDGDNKLDWTVESDGQPVDDKIIDIENVSGTLLPETGGMGTVLFTVVAVVMILGVAISFIRSRKIEE